MFRTQFPKHLGSFQSSLGKRDTNTVLLSIHSMAQFPRMFFTIIFGFQMGGGERRSVATELEQDIYSSNEILWLTYSTTPSTIGLRRKILLPFIRTGLIYQHTAKRSVKQGKLKGQPLRTSRPWATRSSLGCYTCYRISSRIPKLPTEEEQRKAFFSPLFFFLMMIWGILDLKGIHCTILTPSLLYHF